MLLHDLFDTAARNFPNRIALEIPSASPLAQLLCLSYAELNERAAGLAANLAPFARPDALIVILLPRSSADLYTAQLAVLKSGAAFTCIDPAFPDEHLRAVLADAGAVAIITTHTGQARLAAFKESLPPIIDPCAPAPPVALHMPRPDPSHLAYVIYTSGTTGQPKGVLIEHRSIVNLIQSDVDYFALSPDQRIAQCSSPAYDSSIEETWLAWSVGATLIPLDSETLHLGPDLLHWLRGRRISVLCPPPTLLRSMGLCNPKRDLPDLKLLYVGGEALPADLADLWSPGRHMENGYGPTECTVTISRARILPHQPITIGQPVRGNQAYVLNANLDPVADGESGELCIAGISLAREYHNCPDLTAAKFPIHPKLGRIHRTGDLARKNSNGQFEYLGRIDSQVKLRGYRIELEAIEAHLTAAPGVRAAACAVQGQGAVAILVAHILPTSISAAPDFAALKEHLRRALPSYMVPARFALIEKLPTSIGGKLQRSALPQIDAPAGDSSRAKTPPRNAAEQTLAAAFARALQINSTPGIEDDFFLDLGGDSLSAVAVLCELRAAGYSTPTVRDLYQCRTIENFAQKITAAPAPAFAPPEKSPPRPQGRPLLSTAIQSLWLLLELITSIAIAYLLFFELLPLLLRDCGLVGATLLAPLLTLAGLLLYTPLSITAVVLLKRILIGRYRPMTTPVWSGLFTRHWILCSAARRIPFSLFEGTPLLPFILRLLGAKIGRRVHIHRGVDFRRGGWDLLTIGDDVTLNQDAAIRLTELESGQLIIGPITIDNGATVETRAGLSPHTRMEENTTLASLSWLAPCTAIGKNQRYDGVPAQFAGDAPPPDAITRGRPLSPASYTALLLLTRGITALLAAFPLIVIAIVTTHFFPRAADRALAWLSAPHLSTFAALLLIFLTAAALVLWLALQAIFVRLLGPIAPGVFPQFSTDALRLWLKTGIVDSTSSWLSGAIFWPIWLRAAGMRIAPGCEISTLIDTLPETVSIGLESFFADGIYFCSPRRHRGAITLTPTSFGRNTFLGNHAVIPQGQNYPDALFIGVSTCAEPARAPGSAWFGHPPLELPRRQVITADRTLTHAPTLARYLTRFFWELLRFFLPTAPLLVAYEWYARLAAAALHFSLPVMALLLAPIYTLCAAASMCAAIILLKWLLLGKTRPGQHPFWSCWCGRWDFLFMAWGHWARNILQQLEGTLLLNAFLRLTGMHIGRRVILGPGFSQVVDPDMLIFEDDATIACHFQAHSFEDRILKLDRIRIGKQASAGDNGVIFYGAVLEENAQLTPHAVIMKCDRLTAGKKYTGVPTRAAN